MGKSAGNAALAGPEIASAGARLVCGTGKRINFSACCRRPSINAFGPPAFRIAPNSERRVASSLIVPDR